MGKLPPEKSPGTDFDEARFLNRSKFHLYVMQLTSNLDELALPHAKSRDKIPTFHFPPPDSSFSDSVQNKRSGKTFAAKASWCLASSCSLFSFC